MLIKVSLGIDEIVCNFKRICILELGEGTAFCTAFASWGNEMDDGLLGVESANCETRPRIHMLSMVAVLVVL